MIGGPSQPWLTVLAISAHCLCNMKDEPMSFSDRERRELEQIEHSLYAKDPHLEATMKSFDIGVVAIKRISIAVAIGMLGLVGLVAGVVLRSVPAGVVGFLVMLAGGLVAVRAIPLIISSRRHERYQRPVKLL